MAQFEPSRWYSPTDSTYMKGKYLEQWQRTTERDLKDAKLKKDYKRSITLKPAKDYKGSKANLFGAMINDALGVPGDWGMDKWDLKYFKRKIEQVLSFKPKKQEVKMPKKKTETKSIIYALKAIAKKKGNKKKYQTLDKKIKKLEGKM